MLQELLEGHRQDQILQGQIIQEVEDLPMEQITVDKVEGNKGHKAVQIKDHLPVHQIAEGKLEVLAQTNKQDLAHLIWIVIQLLLVLEH